MENEKKFEPTLVNEAKIDWTKEIGDLKELQSGEMFQDNKELEAYYDRVRDFLKDIENPRSILEGFLLDNDYNVSRRFLERMKEMKGQADAAVISWLKNVKDSSKKNELIGALYNKDYLKIILSETFDKDANDLDSAERESKLISFGTAFNRLLEIGYRFTAPEIIKMIEQMDSYGGNISMLVRELSDHKYLEDLLEKSKTSDPNIVYQDSANYWQPFSSLACEIVRKVDPDVLKKVIGSEDYRYSTRLLALSRLRTADIRPEEAEVVFSLLAVPYDEEYDVNSNYVEYDYGKSELRVNCILKGILDFYPDFLKRLAGAKESSPVHNELNEEENFREDKSEVSDDLGVDRAVIEAARERLTLPHIKKLSEREILENCAKREERIMKIKSQREKKEELILKSWYEDTELPLY